MDLPIGELNIDAANESSASTLSVSVNEEQAAPMESDRNEATTSQIPDLSILSGDPDT